MPRRHEGTAGSKFGVLAPSVYSCSQSKSRRASGLESLTSVPLAAPGVSLRLPRGPACGFAPFAPGPSTPRPGCGCRCGRVLEWCKVDGWVGATAPRHPLIANRETLAKFAFVCDSFFGCGLDRQNRCVRKAGCSVVGEVNDCHHEDPSTALRHGASARCRRRLRSDTPLETSRRLGSVMTAVANVCHQILDDPPGIATGAAAGGGYLSSPALVSRFPMLSRRRTLPGGHIDERTSESRTRGAFWRLWAA